ncbi:N-formylglutamate amidohydrolase [Rhodococcus sp. IEGM 1366]|uniref:N-formylglutamate amidohydrolase n=1 Tax=Rhodococcus sp. IEGM 1366 TaxID=3082223 RepID=UPI002952C0C6|nr:N-formylglutamate amidohydrolase [Rhodococcus sp. IEGM 1366]MDV8066127.1 N-formylglutamate amidohydrolase [Rhodococcus sp. IEGM 1366]
MNSVMNSAVNNGAPVLIPAGTSFTPDDLTFYADRESRTLDDAIAGADLLVSCPHSGSAIPEELAEFLAPEFTRRLQFDFTDMSTSAIVRRWAEIDPRIVYVENPHPRMIRDPNRAKPENLEASLREAFARVHQAGAGNKVDLTGVDAVRPVTFSFYPLLLEPTDDAGWKRLADTFTETADRGLGVYERTRDSLVEKMVEKGFEVRRSFTTLSFHDTMNHTTRRDGAVNVLRPEEDRLPDVVALSNRGDHDGNRRGDNPVTMDPELIRTLAAAHRKGFQVDDPDAVALNQPYLGSFEIITAGARFAEQSARADAAGITLSAVQAEFKREFLLGDTLAAHIMEPGVDWPSSDPERVDQLARACKASWDHYRDS